MQRAIGLRATTAALRVFAVPAAKFHNLMIIGIERIHFAPDPCCLLAAQPINSPDQPVFSQRRRAGGEDPTLLGFTRN